MVGQISHLPLYGLGNNLERISKTTTQIDNEQGDDTTCLLDFALLSLTLSLLSYNQRLGIPIHPHYV